MKELRYHFSKPPSPEHVINVKSYGPNDTQNFKIGPGYMPSKLTKISRWRKHKMSLTQYAMEKGAGNDKGGNAISPKSSVFDRLQPPTPQQHPFVFNRMRKDTTSKGSAFHRLREDKQPKSFVFTTINTGGKSSSSLSAQDGNCLFSRLGEVNEVQNSVPSYMKRIFASDIKTDGSLKVKRHTLVITNYEVARTQRIKSKTKSKLLLTLSQFWRLMT